MTPLSRIVPIAALALAPLASLAADTEGKPPETAKLPETPATPATNYFRYDPDGKNGGSGDFELLTRRFRNPKTGAVVTLAGMIHLADPAFYARINALSKQHDVVLLEGVKGGAGVATIPLLYKVLLAHRIIGPARLENQLEQLDQNGPRFRNADVEMKDLDTGSTALTEYLTLPFLVVVGETGYTLSGMAEHLCWLTGAGENYARAARGILAETLADPDKRKEDDDFERVIVKDRNDSVLRALDEELAKPGEHRVLIPWGAAHHEGLEAALLSRGFVAENDEWIRAFSVKHSDTSQETDTGFRWQIPYVACIRNSTTTLDLSGPLGLLAYKDSPKLYAHSSAWGLLHSRAATGDESAFSLLAGIVWTGEHKPAEDEDAYYALLGMWGHDHTKTRDTTRLGWWGFLGGSSKDKNEKGVEIRREWHLPLAFGAKHPLLYGREKDVATGKVTHRFLGFFETVSE